jgi:hypothetical protein
VKPFPAPGEGLHLSASTWRAGGEGLGVRAIHLGLARDVARERPRKPQPAADGRAQGRLAKKLQTASGSQLSTVCPPGKAHHTTGFAPQPS